MPLSKIRVREVVLGRWVVEMPGADDVPFKNQPDAETFAGACRVAEDPEASAETLRRSFESLQRIGKYTHNCLLTRKLFGKLEECEEVDS